MSKHDQAALDAATQIIDLFSSPGQWRDTWHLKHKVQCLLIDLLERNATQPAAGKPIGKVELFGINMTYVEWRDRKMPPLGTELYAAAHGDELYTAQARLSEALSLLRKVDENGEGLYRSLHEDIQSFLAGHPAAHGDEAVRKDAERYRWISANVTEAEIGRSSEFHTDWRRAWKLPLLLSQNAVAATFTFDEAIDAAMRAQAGEGGE